MRDLAGGNQRVGRGKVGAGAAARDVVSERDEAARRARLAPEMAGDVDDLTILEPQPGQVVAVDEHDAAVAGEAAVAVVEAVDGGVVLVVAADRHHQKLPFAQLALRKRMHGEARLAGGGGELSLARAVGQVEPAGFPDALVVALRAGDHLRATTSASGNPAGSTCPTARA